jgi:nucleoside phosphorylase
MVTHNPDIAVTAALAREIAPLRPLAPCGVVFIKTGMGQRNADRAIRAFLAKNKPRLLINTGFAGALSSNLRIGDIVIAKRIRGEGEIEIQERLLSIVRNPSAHYGTAVTVETIASTADKEILARSYSDPEPAWVDMESFTVANACREYQVPFLVIRCVSDLLNDELRFDFNRYRTSAGDLNYPRVITSAFLRPRSIKTLMKYKERSMFCANRIASFLLPFLLNAQEVK